MLNVPILGSDRVLGMIIMENYERENAYGDSDVRLLSTVAASMGVALENARLFDETQRLLKETEQRAAELAVINRIQEGMAAELDFQAIVDLVGDKLREVFKTSDIGIRWYDPKANLIHYLYEYEHGVRLKHPLVAAEGRRRLVEDRERRASRSWPTRARTRKQMGLGVVPGTDDSHSAVFVPIVGSDRVLGLIVMEDYEREYAYGEAEVRLLSTVAASMGVALENARLFDETQRLFKESEQRAAELAIINSVQEALAAEARTCRASTTRSATRFARYSINADIEHSLARPADRPAPLPVHLRARRAADSALGAARGRRHHCRRCCVPARRWSSTKTRRK